MDRFEKPSEEDGISLKRLIRAMEVFREYDTAFPMSYGVAFLMVAARPGETVSFYAEQLGLVQAVTSRLMLEIGQKSRHVGREPLGWIDNVPDPEDLRARKVFLTPKGRQVLRKINYAMGGRL